MGLNKTTLTTAEIEAIRERVRKAIAPLKPADRTRHYKTGSARTRAGQKLPPYYMVYFLLVELLEFPFGGQEEKIAWSVPVDFDGNFAIIEHRKLGLGIFSATTAESEAIARRIVETVEKGIAAATPFFDHLAAEAVTRSQLNVRNNSDWLFNRYEWLRDQFRAKAAEAIRRKKEVRVSKIASASGISGTAYSYPSFELHQQAEWLGIAAIEAFFSWTEHVFILIAILQRKLKTGVDIARLAQAEWSEKIKLAIDLAGNPKIKALIRRTSRNQTSGSELYGAWGIWQAWRSVPVSFWRWSGTGQSD